ncbi:MAG: hypothetical protein AB7F96_20330 [Beijerinckiaceae bacterium]
MAASTRKRPYTVVFKSLTNGNFGEAHYGPPPKIIINKSLLKPGKARALLGTLIHETLHLAGAGQYLHEEAVLELEAALERQLWAAGYRRVETE